MEVNNDLSDLIEKYKYLERDPDIYDRIVENCNKLVIDEISQQKLQYKFLNNLFKIANEPDIINIRIFV